MDRHEKSAALVISGRVDPWCDGRSPTHGIIIVYLYGWRPLIDVFQRILCRLAQSSVPNTRWYYYFGRGTLSGRCRGFKRSDGELVRRDSTFYRLIMYNIENNRSGVVFTRIIHSDLEHNWKVIDNLLVFIDPWFRSSYIFIPIL